MIKSDQSDTSPFRLNQFRTIICISLESISSCLRKRIVYFLRCCYVFRISGFFKKNTFSFLYHPHPSQTLRFSRIDHSSIPRLQMDECHFRTHCNHLCILHQLSSFFHRCTVSSSVVSVIISPGKSGNNETTFLRTDSRRKADFDAIFMAINCRFARLIDLRL